MKKLLPFYFIFVLLSFILPFIFGFNIFLIYLLTFNTIFLICTMLLHKFSSKVFSVLIINIFFMLLGIANNFLITTDDMDINATKSVRSNLESYEIDLKLLIKNSSTTKDIGEQVEYILDKAKPLVTDSNKKSYMDMGNMYEVAVSAGLYRYSDEAVHMYKKYCLLAPNDAECYASIARLLILDVNNKTEALPYALKALELAPDEKFLKMYNDLVNYIEKL